MKKFNFNSILNHKDFSSPSTLSGVIRYEWKWWLPGALFSVALAGILISGWPNGFFPNVDYPYTYINDGAFGAIQRLIEGWIYDNPRSGYPFGSNLLDYPGSDSGNYLILKLIGSLTGDWYSAHNIYFLLGFAVTFTVGFCVLRALGLSLPFAFTAAFLFDFLPFHFQRIAHLFFTWYFVIPIFYYIAIKFFNQSASDKIAKNNLSIKLIYVLCLIALGSFGIYYALFGLIIFFTVALYEAATNYSPRAIKTAFLASSIVFFGVLLNVTPNLIYKFSSGTNHEVAQRGFAESEIYGFKFAQLIMPISGHRVDRMANISAKYNSASPLVNENATSSLGVVGSIGLVAVFALILASLAGVKINRVISIASLIVLVLFMFGTIGGFGSIFAQVITPSIRAWNRISVFIGFGVLLILFMVIQTEIQKRFAGRRLLIATSLITIILLLAGLYDQTASPCKACNEQARNAFNMDRDFIRSIENSLPKGSSIYQLPYMPYPEVPPLYRLPDYGLSVGFLHSSSLHWSYGGMKGRSGDLFYRSLSKEPITKQLEVIKKLGMAGIYIDKRGFADNGNALIKQLTDLLGTSPTLTRSDGEIVFFKTSQEHPVNLERMSAEQIMQKSGYIIDHLGARYIATFAEGINFTRPDFPSFVKDMRGLSGPEAWGRWSDANLASSIRIDFNDPLPNRFNLKFTAQPFGSNTGQDLQVRIGPQLHRFKLNEGLFEYHKMIDLGGEKIYDIEFISPQPISPQQLNISSDSRKLGIGLIRLRFE